MKSAVRRAALAPLVVVLLVLLVLLVPLLTLSCSGGGSSGGSAPEAGTPATFTAVFNDVLMGSCAQSFCHIGPGVVMPLGDQATAYQQTVNAPATGPYCAGMGIRVVPGHPETSLLYLKLTKHPAPCGGTMPGRPPALTTAELNEIEQWIALGAKND